MRVYLHAFTEAEMSCKQGYAFSCIMRGFLALEYGEIMNEMPEARKTAEEYFKKGCAMRDPRGNPFMNPRSCQYRKLAQAKLAEAPSDRAAPGERAARRIPERSKPHPEYMLQSDNRSHRPVMRTPGTDLL
jgi:hypothetical protein